MRREKLEKKMKNSTGVKKSPDNINVYNVNENAKGQMNDKDLRRGKLHSLAIGPEW